jgi:S-adenosylmethionine synthetase
LYADGKAQVAVEYDGRLPVAIANLVISHHAASYAVIAAQLIDHVMKPVSLTASCLTRPWIVNGINDSTVIFVNPTGAFLRGPKADLA